MVDRAKNLKSCKKQFIMFHCQDQEQLLGSDQGLKDGNIKLKFALVVIAFLWLWYKLGLKNYQVKWEIPQDA